MIEANEMNKINGYFLFKERLLSKHEYYTSNYDVTPLFKASMHLGPVTAVEVGSLKREIAYHGDTLNIASRIQAHCKVFKKEFLVSSIVLNNYKNENVYMFEEFDALVLRGKLQSTFLLAVSKKDK